jgi:hypothetical protein
METIDLARALVACPKFHYEQGMAVRVLRNGRWLHGIVDDASGEGGVWVAMAGHGVWINLVTNADGIRLESVDDPATVGHLIDLLKDQVVTIYIGFAEVVVYVSPDGVHGTQEFRGPTLGTALARALLAVF